MFSQYLGLRKRSGSRKETGWILLVVLLFSASFVRPEEPAIYAITNARLVPVSSRPVDKGTVVLRNGIIEAIGAGVTVPKDARVIDGTGLTVYPGLIDALSDVALEETRAAAPVAGAGGRQGGVAALAQQQPQASTATPDERQGLTPYLMGADILNPGNRKIETMRSAGITTALVAPRRGFFQGQSALINLSGISVGKMVVKSPIALHVAFQRGGGGFGGGGGYPGSIMGILAFVKQTFLDAQRYEKAWSIYDANPGAERPEYSRTLSSLQPALHGQLPVVLPGDNAVEIQRSLKIAEMFNLKMILDGGAESGALASLLKEKRISVLLTAKFPERASDGDPEAEEELNSLRRRVEAPATAVALAKAGVQFAFQSDDMANPRDFLRNISRSIDAGLDRDLALRAVTLSPAEIFGVSNRIGSLDKGKTANLFLATGDIFDSRTRVKFVFVDGQKFEVVEQETPRPADRQLTGGGGGAGGMNVSGIWSLKVNSPEGAVDVSVTLRQDGSVLTGTVTSHLGTSEITEGSVSGNSLTFKVNVTTPDGNKMTVSFSGRVQGTSITGSADAGEIGKMDFTGSRSPNSESQF